MVLNFGNLMGRRGTSNNPSVEGGLGVPAGYSGSTGNRVLNRANFYTSNKTMSANNASVYEELGSYQIGAQVALRVGFGSAVLEQNQGYFYFQSLTPASAAIDGLLRINWKSANKDRIDLLKEYRTDTLDGSTTNKEQREPLPELPIRGLSGRNYAAEDEFITLDFLGDSASTVHSTTTSTVIMSTTQYFR